MDGLHKRGAIPTVKRAVLYARVSSDDRDKDGRSLAGQLDMCREYAQKHGYQIVASLSEDDKGASGAALELPQLSQVLELAQAGEVDVLVVREIDRLSRKLAKQLIVEEELGRAGVHIEYALAEYPDSPEGRLNKHIRATIAEYEREKIIERLVRGKRNKVRAGHVITAGRPPYGYREAEQDGKQVLVIHEPEARVVRMIFTWYVRGNGEGGPISPTVIARKLTRMGIPTYAEARGSYRRRANAPWGRAVIYKMLRSKTYRGTWHYGKKRQNGNRWQTNDYEHLLAVDVPAIVDRELWDQVQRRLDANRNSGRPKPKHEYLLSRRATCGHCGIKAHGKASMSGKHRYLYYRCAAAETKDLYAQDCNAPYFRADQVDAAVWKWVVSFLTDPEVLHCGLRAHQEEREKEHAPIRDRLAVVGDLLVDNHCQVERLLDLYLSGEFSKQVLSDRKTRLERTITVLERERAGLIAHLEARPLSTEQIQTIKDFAVAVGKSLEAADDDFATRRRIIEALDVGVTLTVEDGDKIVYARLLLASDAARLHPAPVVL